MGELSDRSESHPDLELKPLSGGPDRKEVVRDEDGVDTELLEAQHGVTDLGEARVLEPQLHTDADSIGPCCRHGASVRVP